MRWLSHYVLNNIYHRLFKHIPESVYWIDEQGKYLGCNAHYRQVIQIDPTVKLTGKDVNQYLASLNIQIEYTRLLPQKSKGYEKTYYFDHQHQATFRIIQIEFWGVTLFIEENLRLHINLIQNMKNKYARLKQKNDKTKAYLNNLIQIIPASVYWKDTDCVILGGNIAHAKLAGFSRPEDVIGKTEYDFVWKDQAAIIIENDKKIMSTGIGLKLEEIATLSDGAIHTFLTSKEPLRDKDSQVIGIIGISVDITEMKNLQNDLREAKEAAEVANFAKTEFIANMSHDVRTPLTGVVGMAQVLEDTVPDPKQKQYAHWLGESGKKLLKMLNQILDVISADNVNKFAKKEEAFDLNEVIQDLIGLEYPSIIMKKIEFHTDIDTHIPSILVGDPKKIHHILLNLLGNAIKFTKTGYVKIMVRLLQKTDNTALLQFEVSDTGIGIPYEAQSKIFDRFFHVTPTYKGTYEGRGLGLHIAQTYVESLGGEITVDSEPGVGTTFSFHIPFAIGVDACLFTPISSNSTAPSVNATQVASFLNETKNKPQILIIEDNSVARTIVELIIQQSGLTSMSAIDGEQALALTQSHPFDLIISDIGLPGISGFEFAIQYRAWEKTQAKHPIPIIGLTAHAENTIRNECLASGMNDVFSKPLTLAILQTIITKFFIEPPMQPTPSSESQLDLGADLPNTETQLFELDAFPLIHAETALDHLDANKNLLITLLSEFITHDIPIVYTQFTAAFANEDWDQIEKLAHKLKGGIMYLGLTKLQYACQYLERYHKAGYTKLLPALYQQYTCVFSETQQAIQQWLALEQNNAN